MSCGKQVGFLMHNGNKDHQKSILTKDCKTLKDIRKKKDSGFGVRLDCGFGKVVGLCLEIAVGEGLKKKGRWHLGLVFRGEDG
jgi:hypothetical protein